MSNQCTEQRHKISFCIVCRNRFSHLKKTLFYNMLDNKDYPDLEILLLNYNSEDDMEEWVKDNLIEYIKNGRVVYYRTFQPSVFNHSHSKNLAFKLATGDVVCNANADIFLGTKFAALINNDFNNKEGTFIIQGTGDGFAAGASGIICVSKKDFLELGGFDERMLIYGWEDSDFVNRLKFLGRQASYITDPDFFQELFHREKYDGAALKSKIHAVYIDKIKPEPAYSTRLLMLFKDLTFKHGFIINNAVNAIETQRIDPLPRFQFEIKNRDWETGSWLSEDDEIVLSFDKHKRVESFFQYKKSGKSILYNTSEPGKFLYEVKDENFLAFILYFEMDYKNRLIMLDNLSKKQVVANHNVFGLGTVFKNFDYDSPIDVK